MISSGVCATRKTKKQPPYYRHTHSCQKYEKRLRGFWFILVVVLFCCWLRVSLCSPGWSGACYVKQIILKLTVIHLPLSLLQCWDQHVSHQANLKKKYLLKEIYYFLFYFGFWDKISLCNPFWPWFYNSALISRLVKFQVYGTIFIKALYSEFSNWKGKKIRNIF